jgi:8-oxo-dGTP pyrophosphatase MutT (NUDIX family)
MSAEITIRRINLNERLAEEIREEIGIDCEAVEPGSLPVEYKPYYSYIFPMSPKIVTNRGCIRVKGKSFDLIHIIQRN